MTQFHDLSECDQNVLLSLVVTGGVSIIAGIMILISFLLIDKIRTYTFGLIFVMTVTEVISRLAYVVNINPPNTGSWQCYTQAFAIQYFISLSMYFSLAVAGHMYMLIAARQVFRMTRTLFVQVVVGACLFALLCACVPFSTNQYGNIGSFCWIALDSEADDDDKHERDSGYAMRVALMHGQIWVIYVLNSLFYVRIYRFIADITSQGGGLAAQQESVGVGGGGLGRKKRGSSSAKDNSVEKTVLLLQYYPIILILTWSPLIVMRVLEYSGVEVPCWVNAVSLGMTNMQGLGNALVFFSYDSVRQSWIVLLAPPPTQEDSRITREKHPTRYSDDRRDQLYGMEMSEAQQEDW